MDRIRWIQRLQSISQAGLAFARDPYDRERYEQVRAIAAELAAGGGAFDAATFEQTLSAERGYPTPKVDVRAVVERGGKLLLVRESQDGLWSLPGGWAELGESPGETAAREVREETGFVVRPVKVLAVYDKAKQGHPPTIWHCYKLFLHCVLEGGSSAHGHETLAIGFFGLAELPALSLERVTRAQLERMFEHLAQPDLPTDFD